jgi:lambda family phage portal protein
MNRAYTITVPVQSPIDAAPAGSRSKSSYDLGKPSKDHERHWNEASNLAAVSAVTPGMRDLLRRRCRYECLNNPYARGLTITRARDVVGVQPRLQLLTPDSAFNSFVESEFQEWCDAVRFGQKLRLLELVRGRDGESFGLFYSNDRLAELDLPSVDLKLIESDQVAHPWGNPWWANPTGDDGVECDKHGNAVAYHVLKMHPGDHRGLTGLGQADRVPASDVIHWYQAERPGQLRGVPELASAMPLFAFLRRITLATLAREEVAASMAATIETDMPVGDDEEWEPFERIAIERGVMTSLPAGWKMNQLQTDRPAAAFGQFVDAILREIGRATDTPFGIVAGDSSKYNYSSARLDHSGYYARRNCDRDAFRTNVLDRLFGRWWAEFQLMYPAAMLAWNKRRLPPRKWHFDAPPQIDPLKEATAGQTSLLSGRTSLTQLVSEEGRDIEEVIAELQRERDLFVAAGLPLPPHLRGVDPASSVTIQSDERVPANAA